MVASKLIYSRNTLLNLQFWWKAPVLAATQVQATRHASDRVRPLDPNI